MKAIRGIDNKLWIEARAQARLQGIVLGKWLQEAIQHAIVSETTLRKRLPIEAPCQLCGKTVYKDKTGKARMVVHHDKPNTRDASVAMILCYRCHTARHRQLQWGMGGRPSSEPEQEKRHGLEGYFKCYLCKKRYPPQQLGTTTTLDPLPYKGIGRKPTRRKEVKICQQCWLNRQASNQ